VTGCFDPETAVQTETARLGLAESNDAHPQQPKTRGSIPDSGRKCQQFPKW
jgi:hypothetical protein